MEEVWFCNGGWKIDEKVIQSYPGKSTLVSELKSSRDTTKITQRKTRQKDRDGGRHNLAD